MVQFKQFSAIQLAARKFLSVLVTIYNLHKLLYKMNSLKSWDIDDILFCVLTLTSDQVYTILI